MARRHRRAKEWDPLPRQGEPVSRCLEEETNMLRINDEAPNFTPKLPRADPTSRMDRQRWAILLAPQGLHPVCTTELGYMAGLQPESRSGTQDHRLERGPRKQSQPVAMDIEIRKVIGEIPHDRDRS